MITPDEVIEGMINPNTNIDMQDSDENTALHHAAANGHLESMQYLISRGAKKDIKNKNGEIATYHQSKSWWQKIKEKHFYKTRRTGTALDRIMKL